MFGRRPKPQPATTSQADADQLADIMASTNAMLTQFNANLSTRR
jgi:hypothetical protein